LSGSRPGGCVSDSLAPSSAPPSRGICATMLGDRSGTHTSCSWPLLTPAFMSRLRSPRVFLRSGRRPCGGQRSSGGGLSWEQGEVAQSWQHGCGVLCASSENWLLLLSMTLQGDNAGNPSAVNTLYRYGLIALVGIQPCVCTRWMSSAQVLPTLGQLCMDATLMLMLPPTCGQHIYRLYCSSGCLARHISCRTRTSFT
jgi:hypothetical protein